MILRRLLLAATLLPAIASCSYLVDGARYLTDEDYRSGSEAEDRLQSAVLIGYSLQYQSNQQASLIPPYTAFLTTRIKTDRDYLNSSIESCEQILLVAGAANLSVEQAVTAGLFCNMGPGKRPDQL